MLIQNNNNNNLLNGLLQNYIGGQSVQNQSFLNQNSSIVQNLGGQAMNILNGQQYGQNQITQLFQTGGPSTQQVLFNIVISTLLKSALTGKFTLSNDGVSNILFQAMINPLVNNRVKIKDKDTTIQCKCSKNFFPVCGQNGITYGNECLAKCNNQSFVYGNCSSNNQVSSQQQNQINVQDQTSQQNDNDGEPIEIKQNDCRLCSSVYQPVCGSDNRTYKNSCQAQCKSIDVLRTGICQLIFSQFNCNLLQMNIDIVQEDAFEFRNNFNKEKVSKNKEALLDIKESNLCVTINDKIACMLKRKDCLVDIYKKRIVVFDQNRKQKNIIMEVHQSMKTLQDDVKKWFRKRTLASQYKSTLNIDFSNRVRESLLTDKQNPVNLKGILHGFLLFAFLNYYRLMFDHTKSFGHYFFKNIGHVIAQFYNIGLFFFLPLFVVFLILVHQIQVMRFKNKLSENTTNLIALIIHSIYLSTSIFASLYFEVPFILSGFVNLTTMTLFLKGISYTHTLYSIRFYIKVLNKEIEYTKFDLENEVSSQNIKILEKYKDNFLDFLTIKQYLYFIMAPTLCYELNYPRTQRIRKMFLFKRVAEMILLQILQLFIMLEYWYPTLAKAPKVFNNQPLTLSYVMTVCEYMIKLSIPMTTSWVVGFFYLFNAFPNALAEILCFGDRHFYNDWWNCKNLAQYWRDWNLPVHNWFLRHVAYPLSYYSISKQISNMIIFFISAVAHEYMFSLAVVSLLKYFI